MQALARLALVVVTACASSPAPARPVAAPPPAQAPVAWTAPQPPEPQQAWAGVRFDATSTRIALVMRDSPAASSGVKPGDVVVSLDGRPATSASQLVKEIRGHAVGDRIELVLDRGGAQLTASLVLGARPDLHVMVKRELEGTAAPAFDASLLAGPHTAKLDDLRGNVIVLDFWATWCGPCRITMPALESWQAKYGPRGLRVVGVSNEELDDVTGFLVDHKFGYTIAHDAGAKISATYMVTGVPTLVIIDRAGVIRLVHLGADDLPAVEAVIQRLL